MTETSESLDSHNIAGHEIHVADRVVNGDAGAEKRGSFGRLDALRNGEDGLAADRGVLGVPTIGDNTVDILLLAGNEVSAVTPRAREAVAAVPSRTDDLANFPPLLRLRNLDDASNNLVAWLSESKCQLSQREDKVGKEEEKGRLGRTGNTREASRHQLVDYDRVGVADARGEDLQATRGRKGSGSETAVVRRSRP